VTPWKPDEYNCHRNRPSRSGLHYRCKSSSAQEGLDHPSDGDLSLKTLLLFGSGLMLWVIYGLLQRDVVIMLANGASLLILSVILYLKVFQERARS
jgi:hypothetical protein